MRTLVWNSLLLMLIGWVGLTHEEATAQQLPDLTGATLEIKDWYARNPPPFFPGQFLLYSGTVTNQGTSPVVNVSFLYYNAQLTDSNGNIVAPNGKTGSGLVTLNIGQTREISGGIRLPSTAPAETYTLTVTIDPDNEIPESDETNNAMRLTFEVAPRPSEPTDLAWEGTLSVRGPTNSPPPFFLGQDFSTFGSVVNQGDNIAAGFAIILQLTDPLGNVAQAEIDGVTVNAGQTFSLGHGWGFSSTTPAGTYTLTVTIDPDNVIPETDEDNNAISTTFLVGELPPPIIIVGTVSGIVGKEVTIPVILGDTQNGVDEISGRGILATGFDIAYNVNALSFEQVVLLDGVAEKSDHQVEANLVENAGSPILKVRTAGASPLQQEGSLFFLKFHVIQIPSDGLAEVQVVHAELETEQGLLPIGPIRSGGVSPLVGDVNQSGQVTAFDGILILKARVGLPVPVPVPLNPLFADVNRDGRVTALDAALIFRFDAGLITELPPPPAKPLPLLTNRIIEVSDVRHVRDHLVVPIWLSDLDGVMAGEMTLAYNSTVVEVVGVTVAEELQNWHVVSNTGHGTLWIAFAGTTNGAGAGDFLNVELRPRKGVNIMDSPVKITDVVLNDRIFKTTVQSNLPTAYTLSQNIPNPFNPETQISFALPQPGFIRLAVYNLTGQMVRTLVNGQRSAGQYTVVWDGTDAGGRAVGSGIYLYRLEAVDRGFAETKRMVLLR